MSVNRSNSLKKKQADAIAALPIYAMLCTSFTINPDATDMQAIVLNEVTGAGYTAGGKALTNKQTSINTTTDKAYMDCDDLDWDASSGTLAAQIIVFYHRVGGSFNAVTDIPLGYVDKGALQSRTNTHWIYAVDPLGLFEFS